MLRALAAAALTAALIPATAEAKTFRGKTSQGRHASVVTGADGVPTKVRIFYKAKCSQSPFVTGGTMYLPPFDSVNAAALQDAGVEHVKGKRKGETARITSAVHMRLHGSHWSGTYRVKLVIHYKGRRIDTCQAKRISWRAK
jgi:hypothetical protein